MKTVHLIYPHGPSISAPDAIGQNLAVRLRERYNVRLYDLTSTHSIKPGPDDVLLGHPHPMPWTCFQRSVREHGWRRILLLSPFHHGDDVQVAFLDPLVRRADRYLAITGNYWFASIAASNFSHWRPKMIHLDLAVDRKDFPRLKETFNPPGKRRFLYIGNTFAGKNVGYLSAIAAQMKQSEFGWIGNGRPPIAGLKPLGFLDFRDAEAKKVVAQYDFMITVGRADANPTTILEAMAWGLIPICTPQSGYTGFPGMINVPLDNVGATVGVLNNLQAQPAETLAALNEDNSKLLDSHFSWDRFAAQVIEAIESTDSPALAAEPPNRRALLRQAALRSPYSPYRPMNLARFIRASLRGGRNKQ